MRMGKVRAAVGPVVVVPDGGPVGRVLGVRVGACLLVGMEALGDVVGIGAIEWVLELSLNCLHTRRKYGIIEAAEANNEGP